MIDSGASKNYLSSAFAEEHDLNIQAVDATTDNIILLANGTRSQLDGTVDKVVVKIDNFKLHKQSFDVLKLGNYDAILRKP